MPRMNKKLTKHRLKTWVQHKHGRGVWLASAVKIHRQTLWQMYAGDRSFETKEQQLIEAMEKIEKAEKETGK
jgi:hypothetical protein